MKAKVIYDLLKKNITLLTVCLAYFSNVFIVNLSFVLKKDPYKFFGITDEGMVAANSQSLMAQHAGILIGVLLFGFLADRKGRMLMLFCSVFVYSFSSLLSGVVTDFNWFLILKFLSGLGTASEFGIGLVIIAEIYSSKHRSYLAAIVAVFGYLAMFLVAFLAKYIDWQTMYIIGSILGLLIMIFRFSTFESEIFIKNKRSYEKEVTFFKLANLKSLLYLVLAILPIYFMSASANFISVSYFKDIKLNLQDSVQYFALGGISCILLSAFFSKKLRSRKIVVIGNVICLFITFLSYFFVKMTVNLHLLFSFLFGLFATYQFELLLLTIENFGTNLRALTTTVVFGFGRSSILLFSYIIPKVDLAFNDYKISCFLIFAITCLIALLSIIQVKEHYNRDLDFIE
jgi:MFS transporter, putative metabolite:H+ symporter